MLCQIVSTNSFKLVWRNCRKFEQVLIMFSAKISDNFYPLKFQTLENQKFNIPNLLFEIFLLNLLDWKLQKWNFQEFERMRVEI